MISITRQLSLEKAGSFPVPSKWLLRTEECYILYIADLNKVEWF